MDTALASPSPAPARHAAAAPKPFGEHLRGWRLRRRMSQLDLAGEADISVKP